MRDAAAKAGCVLGRANGPMTDAHLTGNGALVRHKALEKPATLEDGPKSRLSGASVRSFPCNEVVPPVFQPLEKEKTEEKRVRE